jgi:hypothetical protein
LRGARARSRSARARATIALLLAAGIALPRAAAARAGDRPWYVPDHAKLQLAGDIGFLSPGVGWELAKRRIEVDVFFGWVPEAIGGHDIYSATAKLSFAPWRLRAGPHWRFQPLRTGLQVTWTFGSEYFVRPPGHYPSGYYDFPTALHAGLAVGGAVIRKLPRERELTLYAEAVALDTMLRDWHENRDTIAASDVLSLAIGTSYRF